jgi:hypothetical protein
MAIYYGTSRVTIIENLEGEDVKVQHENIIEEVPIIELEADGGIEEIRQVIKSLQWNKIDE